MQKKLLYSIITTAMFAVAFTGCKKELDLKPLDQVSDLDYWAQPNDFKLAANNFYSDLRTFSQSNSSGDSRNATDLGADRSVYARGTNSIVSVDPNYTAA